MKIFYKKDYEEQLKTNRGLNTLNQKLSADLDKANEDNLYLKKQLELKKADEKGKDKKINDLNKKLKESNKTISDLQIELNLNADIIAKLRKENEDLKSDKYKSRTIRATKSKSQEMNLKTRMQGVAVSKIQKEISENNLETGKENV